MNRSARPRMGVALLLLLFCFIFTSFSEAGLRERVYETVLDNGLEVIAAILSAGKSSRLYRSLVQEKQLVLSADADNSLLSRDPSLFYLSAEPLSGKDVIDVEKALNQQIARLQKEPVGEHELEKAKNQLEAEFIYGQDSLFYQAMLLAQHEIALDWRTIDNYIPFIRSVTREEVLRIAKAYLHPENHILIVIANLKEAGMDSH